MMAKISLRTIDYFKFKNLVIDRSTDDCERCSREVQTLCEGVARLNSRNETFDPGSDRQRLDEVCGYYKLILENRKVIPLDVRLKSGWWGSDRNAYSAGKLKAAALKETLLQKTRDWASKNAGSTMTEAEMEKRIEGPGVFVFKHRERQCFQLVGRTERIFSTVSDNLRASFDGAIAEPLAALLITSMALQWDFYFIPVTNDDGESIQCILENDTILKHDSIWPYGLNFRLNITSFVEVVQLRQSCRRHGWPPERKRVREGELYLNRLRLQVNEACNAFLALDTLNRGFGPNSPQPLSINPDLPSLVSPTPSAMHNRDADRMSISSASSGSSSSLGSSITATTVRTAIQKKPIEMIDQPPISEDPSSETLAATPAKSKPDRSSSVGASIRRTSASRSSSQLAATPRREAGTAVRSRSASHNGSQRSAAATAPKRLSAEGQLNNGSTSGSSSPLSLSDAPRGSSASSPGQAHHQSRLSWECPRPSKQGTKNKGRDIGTDKQ